MEVWIIGDVRFMSQVFNGIALITNHNDWLALIRIGALLGVLLITIRALLRQRLELYHLMAVFLIYGCMFVPRETAVLIDAEDPTVIESVDNVPLGVVFTASLMSKFGKGLTELFEQAFQPVDPSQTTYDGLIAAGYLDPLRHLLKLRETVYRPVEPDLDFNLRNYVNYCTARYLETDDIRAEQIMRADFSWQAARAPSQILTTRWLSGGTVSETTCFDATNQLDNVYGNRANHEQVLQRAVATQIGFADSTQVTANIDPVLKNLAGATADGYKYMFNSVFLQYLVQGTDLATARTGDATYAYIVQSARERRDLIHATERTIFEDIMRPIMTFFEAMVYAFSPLMAFLLVLGPMAMTFASKYLMTVVWVQLWLPTFAIIKLFTFLSLNGEMYAMQVHGMEVNSIEWAWEVQQNLQRWAAISGLLTAATPTITLALVFGGAITANSIASRLQSAGREAASQSANTFTPGLATVGPGGIQMMDRTFQPQLNGNGLTFTAAKNPLHDTVAGGISGDFTQTASYQKTQTFAEQTKALAGINMAGQWTTSKEGSQAFNTMLRNGQTTSGKSTEGLSARVAATESLANQFDINLEESARNGMAITGGGRIPTKALIAGATQSAESTFQNRQGYVTAQQKRDSLEFATQLAEAFEKTRTHEDSQLQTDLFQEAYRHQSTAGNVENREWAKTYNSAEALSKSMSGNVKRSYEMPFPQIALMSQVLGRGNDFESAKKMEADLANWAANPSEGVKYMTPIANNPHLRDNDYVQEFYGNMRQTSLWEAKRQELGEMIPESHRDHLSKSAPPSLGDIPTMTGFNELKNEANTGITSANSEAKRDISGLPSSATDVQAGYAAATADPQFNGEPRRQYAAQAGATLADARETAALSRSSDAGSWVRGIHEKTYSLVGNDNRAELDEMRGEQNHEWRGLGRAAAQYGASFSPDSNIDSAGIDFTDSGQLAKLGVQSQFQTDRLGSGVAPDIAAGDAISGYLQRHAAGDESAMAELKTFLTDYTGSEQSADRVLSEVMPASNRLTSEHADEFDQFHLQKSMVDQGVVEKPSAQRNPNGRAFFDDDSPSTGGYMGFRASDLTRGSQNQNPNTNVEQGILSGDINLKPGVAREEAAAQLVSARNVYMADLLGEDAVSTNKGIQRGFEDMQDRLEGRSVRSSDPTNPTAPPASFPSVDESSNEGVLFKGAPIGAAPEQGQAGSKRSANSYADSIKSVVAGYASRSESPDTFAEQLTDLEAKRVAGDPVSNRVQTLFENSFGPSDWKSELNQYNNTRDRLDGDFRESASGSLLREMRDQNIIQDDSFNIDFLNQRYSEVDSYREGQAKIADLTDNNQQAAETFAERLKSTQDLAAQNLRER